MILFPCAKINIGLYVTNKRTDGYHDIETVFCPIGLADILEVVENSQLEPGDVQLQLSGLPVEGPPASNLVVKAYHLIRKECPIPSVSVYLHKRIPTGAGLGGGSSDGVSMLMALNQLFSLGIGGSQLREMALELGSDCSFFLNPRPSLALGRGDVLRSVGLNACGLYLYLFLPSGRISTAEAYRHVTLGRPVEPLDQIVSGAVEGWKGRIVNAFEPYAIAEIPEIATLVKTLYKNGALYCSLTGSGSAVYGFFKEEIQIPAAIEANFIWKGLF